MTSARATTSISSSHPSAATREVHKQVFDPLSVQSAGGRYVPALVAAIGGVPHPHMIEAGFLSAEPGAISEAANVAHAASPAAPTTAVALGPLGPKCNQPELSKEAGYLSGVHCGWSEYY